MSRIFPKTIILLCICICSFFSLNFSLAQGIGTYQLTLSGVSAEPDYSHEWANGGTSGRYWAYEYDKCEAKLNVLMYLYENNSSSEVEDLYWEIKDGANVISTFEYKWANNGTSNGFKTQTGPLTGTPISYKSTGNIDKVRFFDHGDRAYVEFEWHLPAESGVFNKTFTNHTRVEWDETGSNDVVGFNFNVEHEKLPGFINAPSVSKGSVGDDEPAMDLSFSVQEACSDNYENNLGPFYRVKRYIFNEDDTYTLDHTFEKSRFPTDNAARQFSDSGSNFDVCVVYSYAVETIIINNQGEILQDESPKSTPFSFATILDEPDNIQASQNSCDGAVTLNWSWTDATPEGFIISRKLPDENVFTNLDTVAGTLRQYENEIPEAFQSQNITYRVATLSLCGPTATADLSDIIGVAPAPLEVPTGITAEIVESGGGKFIRLGWDDNSSSESKYIITRQFQSGGGLVTYEVDANSTSFDDLNVSICQPYRYQVKVASDCAPDGIFDEDEEIEIVIDSDISQVIRDNSLTASRGYFKDRVELNWAVFSEFNSVSRYKIFSRPLGTDQTPVLVSTVNGSERTFDDEKAEAGQLLEYFIVGETDCGENLITTYDNEDFDQATEGVAKAVGFRSPEGVINGNIAYAGGNAVADVKVIVENESGSLGQSLNFDGTGTLTINDDDSYFLAVNDSLGISFYLKPDFSSFSTNEAVLVAKDEYFRIKLSDQGALSMELHDGTNWNLAAMTTNLADGTFQNLNITYSGQKVKFYLDGQLVNEVALAVSLSSQNIQAIVIGEDYAGLLDELSVWNKVRDDEQILRDFVRLKSADEEGMLGYWPFNVGVGNSVFDGSRRGNSFNGHDGVLANVTWSDDIPGTDQLSTIGYTNTRGNYTISGVKFKNSGENFTVTPTLGVHEFSPNQKIIFIGDGNLVQNGVDFEDKSSFRVTGKVVFSYKDLDAGSEGVEILLDGEPVIDLNGEFLKTNDFGQFELDVPIGEHFLTVKKDNHIFEDEGRFPAASGTNHNFNEPISGLTFYDETTRKLIGKVVGGTREGDKPVGFNKTINNIGQAGFTLKSKDGLIEEAIVTDVNTGEYEIELPPKVYDLLHPVDESIGSMRVQSANLKFDTDFKELDLLNNFQPGFERDTVLFSDNIPLPVGAVRIDTVDNGTREVRQIGYDYKVNHIYRKAAEVFVYDGDEKEDVPFLGEREYIIPQDGEDVKVPLIGDANEYLLNYPVLQQNNTYKLRIAVNEVYSNHDSGSEVQDNVPVTDAIIQLENNMMTPFYFEGRDAKPYPLNNGVPFLLLNEADGDTTLRFATGEPEFNPSNDPALSYTRSFKVTVLAGGNVVNWPNPNDQSEVFPVYVLGDKANENFSFVSSGPSVVKHIIRDPYGGESYAYLEEGSTVSTSSTYSFAREHDTSVDLTVGYNFPAAKVTVNGGFEYVSSYDSAGSVSNEITFTERFQTRADAQEVGAGGDIYVSESKNYEAGFSDRLKIILKSSCDNSPNITCLDDSPAINFGGEEYVLASTYAAFMKVDGDPTLAIYSQNHILNVLIPDLENIRNSLFDGDNSKYVSNVPADHELFGTNNDDNRWNLQDNDPNIYDFQSDSDGPSYTFTNAGADDIDSVAWINQQIRLWQNAIRRNEKEKAEAVNDEEKENFSVAAGVTFGREVQSTNTTSYEVTYGTSSAFSVGLEVDIDPDNKPGLVFNLQGNYTLTESVDKTTARDSTFFTTYGYEIFEPDVGDFISFDVVPGANGDGPIFILQGGETSCPHEEAVTTMFYNPGTVIGKTTFQRDKPRLDVDVSQLYNVPADGQAAFNLTLSNDSESGDGFNYTMFVIDESNPDGAIISMDGEFFDQNRTIFVNGKSSIRKTVTVERGPVAYDYEDIKIVFASICQSDPTDFERIIADTVSVSAFFLPICTTPEILSPDDNWTLNNRFDDQMEVLIGDYDINFPGFEYLELQYKSAESSSWIPVQRFYRDLEQSGNPDGGIQIPRNNPNISYMWNVENILDGNYDLRVVSDCEVLATQARVNAESGIKSGIIDRINPHVFGSPQPADGILSPGDEIRVQFNEPINTSLLTPGNFSIKGVLNGGELRHNVSVAFDGSGNESIAIANPPNLRRRDFTIDFWARRNTTGEEVLLHQGATEERKLQVGFDGADKVYFEMNQQRFTTDIEVTGNVWTHYSFSYDYANSKVIVTVASAASSATDEVESFDQDYEVNEPLLTGLSSVGEKRAFNGNLHELRIWSRVLGETEIAVNRNLMLNASTAGLLANWPFDDAVGTLSLDIVKVRQARINAGWSLEPSGKSVSFDGTDDYLESNGIGSFDTDQGFTIELWFKTSSDAAQTLFSNGKGETTDDNERDWAVNLLEGKLNVQSNGKSLDLDTDLADGSWHHLAIAVNRTTNIQVFVDGELRKSTSSDGFAEFGNDLFWYGRRSWTNGGSQQSDQHFDGALDEFRLWRTVRSQDEIRFNRHNNLNGDELGLVLYYPFEAYTEQNGILLSNESNASQVAEATNAADFTLHASFDNDVPAIRLPRPLEVVNFNYSANGDQIILTTNEDNQRLENVILDIGVKNIRDLNGNQLDAPITWTAFVDRNDVVWLEDELSFDKPVNDPFSFTTRITNTGGQVRNFEISNLPFWLTASPSSGQIEPTRSQDITFTINPGINIGTYTELIHLTTEFGFDEKLSLEVNVFQSPPDTWTVDPQDFQSSMSVVGQIEISGILSRDENDLIAAFVDNECRGIAPLRYFQAFDNYQAFLSIYTDVTQTEKLTYKIWDASEGKIYTGLEVTDNGVKELTPDGYFGEPAAPVIFKGSDFIEQNIEVQAGWQWISFNLASADLADVNEVFKDFEAAENDQIKGFNFFDQYDPVNGWIGTLSANGGLKNERMYKLNTAGSGRIAYSGSFLDAPTLPIGLEQGWNWLGFYGQQNQDLNEALSDISNLSVGDRIKGQLEFAVYGGQGVGWVGSLTSLKPGEGYMYLAQADGVLTYPENTGRLADVQGATSNGGDDQLTMSDFNVNPGLYESNMSFIINLEGERRLIDGHILVSAGTEAVGWGDLTRVGEDLLFFVTVHGDRREDLSFEYVRRGERIPLVSASNTRYQFTRNGTAGSLEAPEVFTLASHEEVLVSQAVPNPFDNELTVSWSENESPVSISLVTINGEEVRQVDKPTGSSHTFRTGGMAQGIYLVRLAFTDKAEVIKVMKNH